MVQRFGDLCGFVGSGVRVSGVQKILECKVQDGVSDIGGMLGFSGFAVFVGFPKPN